MCINNGVTVVVITHNMALTPMGNKVIKVKNGAISDISVNDNLRLLMRLNGKKLQATKRVTSN